jgi:hypothetical protein
MKPHIEPATYIYSPTYQNAWIKNNQNCNKSVIIQKNQIGLLIKSECRKKIPKNDARHGDNGFIYHIELIGGPDCGRVVYSLQESDARNWLYYGINPFVEPAKPFIEPEDEDNL